MLRPPRKKEGSAAPEDLAQPPPSALPLESCLAKTRVAQDGTLCAGRTVEDHCRIVEAVASCLLAHMPPVLRALFPEQAEKVPGIHDVGKICPTFQKKIYLAAGQSDKALPQLHNVDPSLEKNWGGHSAVSMATLKACRAPDHIARIAGQHHGFTPQDRPADCGAFGAEIWQERRSALLARLLGCPPESPAAWPHVRTPEQARLLAGFTTVADWIGSGARFDDPAQPWQPLVEEAVRAAGFVAPTIRSGLRFEDIFTFPPLETQQCFYEQVHRPGVYVLEAPMGLGKTEAALYAAYRMLESRQSSGIYFALPTQLTSNRIHSRMNAFLEKILADEAPTSAYLLHGKAWLHHFLQQEMGEDAAPSGAWFSEGRRGILAPFATGTVDQALMAAMHVRHGAVRAYGLAGKTVILDEVHSYDAYTGVILDALVSLLRHYDCTVIILSATLTAARRAAFTETLTHHAAYPLISLSRAPGECQEIPCPPPPAAVVSLTHGCTGNASADTPDPLADPTEKATAEAIARALQGQQVLWIENTVAEAQARYRLLAARTADLQIDTGVLHSRFTPADRHRNEAQWTALYGKNAPNRSEKGRLLVGTQVLEQSLDIDADFLVTRFCPTDMLLQRLGRLWRHAATVRPPSARREAWLLHPALSEATHSPEAAWEATGHVYMPYVLYRSLEQWAQRTAVTLPDDMRALLEATYAEREEADENVQRMVREVLRQRETLRGQALQGVSTGGTTLPEEKASTRIGQRPEADVLLLRGLNPETGTATLPDETEICLAHTGKPSWTVRQQTAARLLLHMVRVPEYMAPASVPLREMRWLSPWVFCGANTHAGPQAGQSALRVAIIRPDARLYDLHGRPIREPSIRYRRDYGYCMERR